VRSRLLKPARDGPRLPDAVLLLTAICLLLRPLDVWWVTGLVLLGAGLAVLYPAVRHAPPTWGVLAILVALRIAAVWPLSDNHIYLLSYWCLAIALALGASDPPSALSRSSRWLLGAAFAFAVLWKAVLSPDYLDGRFFRVTMLTDPRFADAVMLVGGLTADDISADRTMLEPLPEGAVLADPPAVHESSRFRAMAVATTWGALLLEALVAVLCLMPESRRVEVPRHAAILAFCITTYALAPVAGFGWLIAVMGLAQCRTEQRLLRASYTAVFFLVLLYSEVPWTGVLHDLVS